MRLKYHFVVRQIAGEPVAVAVGQDNMKFHGMIKMNHSAAFVFRQLSRGDVREEELVQAVMTEYALSREEAHRTVAAFLAQLWEEALLVE